MKLLHQSTPYIQLQNRSTLDFPLHIHDVLELAFVRAGTTTAVTAAGRYFLQPGDVFVVFPDVSHGYEESRDIQSDVLIVPTQPYLSHWRATLTQKLPVQPVLKAGSWEHTGIGQVLSVYRQEYKLLSEPVKQGLSLLATGMLLPLLELKPRQETDSTLELLLLYISEHYRENLTRTEIARAVGYNESYVSHMFSQSLGTSLTSYITSLRLKDAKALLTDTDMTVSQICMTVGFGSIRSFNRAFLKEFGICPSQYRAVIAEAAP